MNLSEHIATATKFQGQKPEMTLVEAEKTPTRATASFGASLMKRLAESKKASKAEERPAHRNPSILCS